MLIQASGGAPVQALLERDNIWVSSNETVQMNEGTSETSYLNAFLEANWII
jgi:hypothetical protein